MTSSQYFAGRPVAGSGRLRRVQPGKWQTSVATAGAAASSEEIVMIQPYSFVEQFSNDVTKLRN